MLAYVFSLQNINRKIFVWAGPGINRRPYSKMGLKQTRAGCMTLIRYKFKPIATKNKKKKEEEGEGDGT
jgi:hypothetical protein